ncbi:hypothetical protein GOBAR_AA29014 [Gossypium barbadense]|uniref:Sieve element occlusion N-terminal domain-containing protein n=1 Tax=Gossypium barbadense TaxID=3634 RepID=A0A2P5WKR1_GOSBA|nr:hypothetical protein GOBAR_AA29014 [Gossypium barbadense]
MIFLTLPMKEQRIKYLTATRKRTESSKEANNSIAHLIFAATKLSLSYARHRVLKDTKINQPSKLKARRWDMLRTATPGASQALMKSPSATHALIRGDRTAGMLTMSDDHVMMNQILATHAPDGRDVDVRPLLYLVEDILNRATEHVNFIIKGTQAQIEMEEKAQQANYIAMLEALTFTIDRIACELSYKALRGSDPHATTTAIFSFLSSYAWDAKLVLSLSAFALNYGEFWLLAQIYSTNQLAKSMAILKQLPSLLGAHSSVETPVQCAQHFDSDNDGYAPALASAMTLIPTAVYWTIRSMVACATQISSLTSMGHEYGVSATESWELSTLAHKLQNIHEHLRKQLNLCYQHIEEKKDVDTFHMLLKLFDPNVAHIDNMKHLKALIYAGDDKLPLLDGATRRKVGLEVLRRRNVLLLISSLEFSGDELAILEQIYSDTRMHEAGMQSHYEVVWIPVVEHSGVPLSEETRTRFEALRSSMPWYSVEDPLLIEKPVLRFIKEIWHFRTKPILVVLDPRGKVLSQNAIHMMWIWGSAAFPFTSYEEEKLWRDDIEWISKFVASARTVASAFGIPLEMVYVGKSNKREQVKKVAAIIKERKLSHCWEDPAMVWFFWTRLESMMFSKIQLGRADDLDPIVQGIKKLLSYGREGGWAVLSDGSNILVNGHSTTVLPTLVDYVKWRGNVAEKGFNLSFIEYHDQLHNVAHPCCRFEFLATTKAPESIRCPECHRVMEKHTAFVCCHDEQAIPDSLFAS